MPQTPAIWKTEFTVNTTTTGIQNDPAITQLGNGNILVSWTSHDNSGAGSQPGTDVIGQILDPLGNRIGGEFSLNYNYTVDNEGNAQVTALPGGGFVVAYEDDDAGNNTYSIRLDEFDSTGALVSSAPSVADDTISGAPSFYMPAIAASNWNSTLIAYQKWTGTSTQIVGRIYSPSTNLYSGEIPLLTIGGVDLAAPEVAVLANGNYVITTSGSTGVLGRIVSSTGTNVLGAFFVDGTNSGPATEGDATVTALAGGGFVIAWREDDGTDTDILFQIFDSAGSATTGTLYGTFGGFGDNANEPTIAALPDGGFILVYDEDGLGEMRAQRFDAAGNSVGNTITLASGASISDISAIALGDGRVAITFEQQSGEIGMMFLDTRDAPNPTAYSGLGWQIGTAGADLFTPDGTNSTVATHSGNDIVDSGGGMRTYLLGAGNDRINVWTQINDDSYFGGKGRDTIDWSHSGESGIDIDLRTGTATDGTNTEVMAGFENAIGTAGGDTITGNAANNTLRGGGGNDGLFGNKGDDRLFGGSGGDNLTGGKGADLLDGGAGSDWIWAGSGADTLVGGKGMDYLFGEGGGDRLSGGGGKDYLLGGTGDDRLSGGGDVDTFAFDLNFDRDRITDFQDNIDTIRLNPDLWGAGKTVTQVLAQYAVVAGGNVVFEFGGGKVLTVEGITNRNLLLDDLEFALV
ncbi:MAG: hypothetical protein IT542_05135 [Rubellimicrobium sp.]|nr:hypothetical protein [Rubellimicrobium sp.]